MKLRLAICTLSLIAQAYAMASEPIELSKLSDYKSALKLALVQFKYTCTGGKAEYAGYQQTAITSLVAFATSGSFSTDSEERANIELIDIFNSNGISVKRILNFVSDKEQKLVDSYSVYVQYEASVNKGTLLKPLVIKDYIPLAPAYTCQRNQ